MSQLDDSKLIELIRTLKNFPNTRTVRQLRKELTSKLEKIKTKAKKG